MNKPKTTQCPGPQYREYKPDQAMRRASEKAAKDQPPMIGMASKVPSYRVGE